MEKRLEADRLKKMQNFALNQRQVIVLCASRSVLLRSPGFQAEAGLNAAVGEGGSWLKSDKRVSIHIGAGSKGLALQFGVGGLNLSF